MGEEFAAHTEALAEQGRPALADAVDDRARPPASRRRRARRREARAGAAGRGRQHDARLIVVGTYGESPLRGAILGSTPHKLLHWSTRPVLCVPPADDGGMTRCR